MKALPSYLGKPFYSLSLTPDLELQDISGYLTVDSLQSRQFSTRKTALIEALQSGTPVVLRNLHKNPVLQRQLEGLLQKPCQLLINGQRQEFPHAKVCIVKPSGTTFCSPVWDSIQTESMAPDVSPLRESGVSAFSSSGSFSIAELRSLEIVRKFLESMCSVPRSHRKLWPWPHPQLTPEVLEKIIRQARVEQRRKGLESLQPECWHRAVATVIIDEYKGHKEVYSFLMQRCDTVFCTDPEEDWRNDRLLQDFLQCHNGQLDREIIRENFWQLSRAFPATRMSAESYSVYNDRDINTICLALLEVCPAEQRRVLAKSLKVSLGEDMISTLPPDEAMESGTDEPSWQESRHQQLTMMMKHHRMIVLTGEAGTGKTYTARQVAREMNPSQPPVTVSAGPQSNQASLLQQQVSMPFVRIDPQVWQAQGLTMEEIQQVTKLESPDKSGCVLLNQDTGSKLRSVLGRQGASAVLQKLKPVSDTCSHLEDGPVLRWARMRSTNGQPVTLIIDEANLAEPALWDIFQGLFAEPPCLSYGGDRIELSPRHRVIMTGNPETAPGRRASPFVRDRAVTLYFEPIPEGFLKDSLLAARLADCSLTSGQKESVADQIMLLWHQFTIQLPDHEFTPRDLHEICDRLSLHLERQQQSETGELDSAQIQHLVWQAASETFGGEFPPDGQHLESLRIWFESHTTSGENISTGESYCTPDADFDKFYQSLKSDASFTFSGPSVYHLSRQYWTALNKVAAEKRTHCVLPGKHATWVEGPPGRGKDELLAQVLTKASSAMQPGAEPVYLNAGVHGWDEMRDMIREAAAEGRIIVISELNLMKSEFLEQELNDLLTGEAKPGFHLFVTVNPPEFSGREDVSPALKSRFVLCRIGDYSDSELETIAVNSLPEQKPLALRIARWHCKLRSLTLAPGATGMPPSTSDLCVLLNHIGLCGKLEESRIRELFCRQYRPLMDMVEVGIADLEIEGMESDPCPADSTMKSTMKNERSKLLRQLYSIFPQMEPVVFSKGHSEGYVAGSGTLLVRDDCSPEQVAMIAAEGLRVAEGLPKSFPVSHDTLATALFKQWQQQYILDCCGARVDRARLEEKVRCRYPLTPEEQRTLARPENKPFVRAINKLLKEQNHTPGLICYREFLRLLTTFGAHLDDDGMVTGDAGFTAGMEGTDEPSASLSETVEALKVKPALVSPVPRGEEGQGRTCQVERIYKDFGYEKNRGEVIVPGIDEQGEITLVTNSLCQMGVNDVTCPPRPDNTVLNLSQHVGVQNLPLQDGEWHVIAGLTSFPEGKIIWLTPSPACPLEVLFDRGTSLYMVRVKPDALKDMNSVESVKLEIVLEVEAKTNVFESCSLSFIDPEICPALLKQVIDQHESDDIASVRDRLHAADTLDEKLVVIKKFCLNSNNTEIRLESSGKAMLSELLASQSASPTHRAIVFWMLATWIGIPVRLIRDQDGRRIQVEVSRNGGFTWECFVPGGKVKNTDNPVETDKEFPDVIKEETEDLVMWSHRTMVTAQQVIHYMNTIRPGSKEYGIFVLVAPRVIAATLSVSGPVGTKQVKDWLEVFCGQAREQEKQGVLTRFLEEAVTLC